MQSLCNNLVWCALSDPAQIVIRPNQTTAVDAGNSITFVCMAYGDPNPSISWNRRGTALSNNSRITIFEELLTENEATFVWSILELCSAEEADAGQYSCIADNILGNDTASFVLTVNPQCKYCSETHHGCKSLSILTIQYTFHCKIPIICPIHCPKYTSKLNCVFELEQACRYELVNVISVLPEVSTW